MVNLPGELTDRDIALLHILGRCGIMKPAQANVIYGGVKKYHIRRIEKLSKAGMIIRDRGYIRPTKKGLQAAGYDGEFVRILKHQYKDRALAVELLLAFPEWDISFGIELKRRDMIERRSQIAGVIERNNLKYAFYLISHIPSPGNVTFIRSELRDLRIWGIDRIGIFCTNKKIIEALTIDPPTGIKECCLLPYPAGVDSFRRIFAEDFVALINQHFPGVKVSNRPFAHFEWQGNYITVMHTNDLVKRQALINYLTYAQKRESRKCILVCTPGQAKEIKNIFMKYDVELIIDEGTNTKIQKSTAPEKEDNFISFSHYPIHP
jgi:hypothetical protein